jgi:hypothetical protein
MNWKVVKISDEGILSIEIRDNSNDEFPIYVHNMTVSDESNASAEIQSHCNGIYEKIVASRSTEPQPLSNLIGLTG